MVQTFRRTNSVCSSFPQGDNVGILMTFPQEGHISQYEEQGCDEYTVLLA